MKTLTIEQLKENGIELSNKGHDIAELLEMKTLTVKIVGNEHEDIDFDIDSDGDLCINKFGKYVDWISNEDAIKLRDYLIKNL